MHPVQKQIYRSMTAEQKLQVAMRLYNSARQFKAAAIRLEHPDWNEKEVQEKVREIFLNAGT